MCMLAIGAFQLRVQNATINISGNQAVHKARKANFFDTFLILFSQNQSSPLNTLAVLFINLNRPAKLKRTWFRFHQSSTQYSFTQAIKISQVTPEIRNKNMLLFEHQ